MINVFDKEQVKELTDRIEKLTPETTPQWGKMNVAQMLAHCNVTYEMVYDDIHPKAKGIKKMLLTWFVKPAVVGPKPYKKNLRTAPQFLVPSDQEFNKEKQRLIDYVNKTQLLGPKHFDGLESNSFGKLKTHEWNMMFSKHLDHHLTQFGV